VYATHGWEDGWTHELVERGGVWSTGLHALGENEGNGSGIGYRCRVVANASTGGFIYADAGTPFDRLMSGANSLGNSHYVALPAGAVQSSIRRAGLVVDGDSPLLASGDLRFKLFIGRHASSSASLRPVIRFDDAPYTVISEHGPFPMSGPDDIRSITLEQGGVAAGRPISCLLARPGAPDYETPLTALYASAEDPHRSTGFAYHVLYYRGGHSARTMAHALRSVELDQLRLFFSLAVGDAGGGEPPMALVRINTGLNDLREANPSVGEGLTPGSSPAAYADNLRSIMDRVTEAWTAAGFGASELHFLLTPSHPIAGPDGETLSLYRAQAEAVALSRARTACVRLDRLTTWQEMLEQGWYQLSGADQYHLQQSAYRELSRRELDALGRWCPGDWNGDGAVDSDDLILFLTDWERGEADADRSGSTDSDDLLAFFGSWDGGGCDGE